ncbi:MAG: zinc ribbon domain-containing protein [Firmicutes bacterium]|nr:zinc ribbon domain-containing protein [Bacillota bacterium]
MFFIGIFGIRTKRKKIQTRQGACCPICGAYDRFAIVQEYQYLHFFFIPLWRWNTRYFLETRCCGERRKLSSELGKRIAGGEEEALEDIKIEDHLLRCPFCSKRIDPGFLFCPHCGQKLV